MADTKTSALTELTAPASVDLLPIVDDPGGTPVTKRVTVANLLGNVPSAQGIGWADAQITRGGAGLVQVQDLHATDDGTKSATSLRIGSSIPAGFYQRAGLLCLSLVSGRETYNFGSSAGLSIAGSLNFGSDNPDFSIAAADLRVFRDAANTLAQRNGTAAQESRVYGTFTDASNHRRLAMGMSSAGVAFLRPEGAGTGASGNVLHISGLPTSNPGPGILWNNAGTIEVGT